jgi:protein SCO1/2
MLSLPRIFLIQVAPILGAVGLRARLTLALLLFSLLVLDAPALETPKSVPNTSAVNLKVPDFVLINQDNERFDSAKMRGKVVALNFIFTTCSDVCPIFTANLAQLQRTLNGRHADDVFFVSITTDPEVDSPKVLKAYAQRYNAELKNWAFLTGSEAELSRVWKSFGIRVVRKARGLIQHDSLTTVIDQKGIRRFNHYGEKWRAKDMEKDMLSLLEKKS